MRATAAFRSRKLPFHIAAGESATWTFEVRCLARGRTDLGRFHVRAWAGGGLRVVETRHDDPRRVSVYPSTAPLRHLAKPRDAGALARCILRMIEDPGRAVAMARTGRKRVEAEFSVTAKLDRTEALYRRLLAAKRLA